METINHQNTLDDKKTQINITPSLDKSEWYDKTKEHWEKSEPTVKGVLGGNDEVHSSDVKTSCELLEGLIQTKRINTNRVIDCGAGIGRVTSNVLVKYFEECDIMEQDEKFIEACKLSFKEETKVKNIYQSSLQNFEFEKKYNVIWVQWCLENLDDEDLVKFMTKCRNNLTSNAAIIIKENIVTRGAKFVKEDYSRVRSDKIFKNIFEECGLKIIKHFHHPNWPKGYMKVSIFVIISDEKSEKNIHS